MKTQTKNIIQLDVCQTQNTMTGGFGAYNGYCISEDGKNYILPNGYVVAEHISGGTYIECVKHPDHDVKIVRHISGKPQLKHMIDYDLYSKCLREEF